MNKVELFKSERLRKLLTLDNEEGGMFPSDIKEAIKQFETMIVWKKAGAEDEIPEP